MDELFSKERSVPTQFVKEIDGIPIFIKREDLLHPVVSGNKFRKLKYNLQKAISQGKNTVLTFGGAYSNHIPATAQACKICGLQSIGVIRGEELAADFEKTVEQNETLKFAVSCGMKLVFVSRKQYREKNSERVLEQLGQMYGDFYPVPEGGTNALAVKGCEEILTEK
ncbi:MAG TPA: 1-aminocyclopropane-1-carboxylate deaminase/D-cysteine desulfhydrase, partial [Salinimicrobium sp.]|nr:1-aminocyclopropane-1-carboxylate deaminase/D-cysteine desulfhydrase [Salinimicrobium sp.]